MKYLKRKQHIFIVSGLICISVLLGMIINSGYAWDQNPMIAPAAEAGTAPTLDGIMGEDDGWENEDYVNLTAQSKTGSLPGMNFYALTSSNYLYILIEVRIQNPNDDQYIKLLMSNSTADGDDEFMDAKLIQNRNLTQEDNRTFYIEDQIYDNETDSYLNDTDTDFYGAANISGINDYTYYEFKIPFAIINDDKVNDTRIFGGGTIYAIKVQYGVNEEGGSYTEYFSPVLDLQIGVVPEEGDPDISPYDLNIDLISNIMFIIAGVAFAFILITSFQARVKLD
ncbi:MAG: hypothetical protein GF364_09870 [Candidatus Lokiarchaeota archaeon]|nr:hypothetical protein [Candidatus Lokiarchaeota archaeon]